MCGYDRNDLKLGTVVDLDAVLQPTDFWFRRAAVKVRVQALGFRVKLGARV